MGVETIWMSSLAAFVTHIFRTWTKPMQIEWLDFFRRRGIFVDEIRVLPVTECMLEFLYMPHHIRKEDGDSRQAYHSREHGLYHPEGDGDP